MNKLNEVFHTLQRPINNESEKEVQVGIPQRHNGHILPRQGATARKERLGVLITFYIDFHSQ